MKEEVFTHTSEECEGISDYYFGRNKPPKWMILDIHKNLWKRGWRIAQSRDINYKCPDIGESKVS